MNKFILTLLASGVSLLALTGGASADPATIGSFILLNLLPGLIGTGIGPGLIGSIALGAAAIGANLAIALASRQKIDPAEYKNTFSTGESSEMRAVGRIRVGGLKAFGNTKLLNRYRLICHVKGPIDGIETHYLGGREVTVESDGQVNSPPWSYYDSGAGETTSNVYINTKVGDGTETAWSDLTTDFPTQWTSSHRVRGIAQALVKYISPGISSDRFLQIFQSLPDYETVLRADKVYDPRDVGQSVDTSSTWEWSDNGILCAVHILRSYPNFTSSDFDWDGIEEQADLADVLVDTLTGTEKRARCWGLWPSENQRNDVMQQVLDSIGAEIVPGTDDKILVRLIDDSPTAEIEYEAKHIVGLEMRYGPEAVERPNLCTVKYYSPERNYEMAEIDMTGIAWARIQDEIDNYGEKTLTVELPFCPSASQAQRIARRLFLSARADTGVITLNQTGMAAWGLRYASFEFPDIGTAGGSVSQTCAIEVPRDNPDEPTVEIPFLVWPSLPSWNPEDDEAAAPEELPDLDQPSDLTTPDMPASATQIEYPDTTREVRVAIVEPAGATYREAVYRRYTGGNPSPAQSMTENVVGVGVSSFAWRTADEEGEHLDFRFRIFDADGNASSWSPTLDVPSLAISNTAPDAPTQDVTGVNGDWDVEVTTANSLNVAYIEIEKNVAFGGYSVHAQINARPSSVYNSNITDGVAAGQSIFIRSRSFSTDGTASAYSSVFSFTEPL